MSPDRNGRCCQRRVKCTEARGSNVAVLMRSPLLLRSKAGAFERAPMEMDMSMKRSSSVCRKGDRFSTVAEKLMSWRELVRVF